MKTDFVLNRFYDGICLWEEGSSTPILHSWWARYFTLSISRFPPEIRESFGGETEKPKDENVKEEDNTHVRRSSRKLGSPDVSGMSKSEQEDGFASPKSSATNESSDKRSPNNDPETKLHLCSHKMKALKDILTSGKKINTQAVSLLLTAQSQVQFVKRRSTIGDYSIEYKRSRKSKDSDS